MKQTQTMTLAQYISGLCQARLNCQQLGNSEWFRKHEERLKTLERNFLPRGSGIDSGTQIDLDASDARKIVLHTAFHHMNDGGMYDGWTKHTITVLPTFNGLDIRISGRNRNDIKDYLIDIFNISLCALIVDNGTCFQQLQDETAR